MSKKGYCVNMLIMNGNEKATAITRHFVCGIDEDENKYVEECRKLTAKSENIDKVSLLVSELIKLF